jgi:hypothetical protein
MANVTIYEHANYQGNSQILAKGRYDDAQRQLTIGNDKLSSVKIPPGLVVRLYEHFHFQGRYVDFVMDTPAVPMSWNDRASSIIVFEATEKPPVIDEVMIFEHAGFTGQSQTLKVGRFDSANSTLKLNRLISSSLIPRGLILRLYEQPGFQGASIDLASDAAAFSADWNDRVSSVEVLNAPPGLVAQSTFNSGLWAESINSNAVVGYSSAEGHSAIAGENGNTTTKAGPGVYGKSAGTGVWGESTTWVGVYGSTLSTTGGAGVWGESHSGGAGVVAVSNQAGGVGIYARGKRLAGLFEGDVEVTGDVRVTGDIHLLNADFAEDFTIARDVFVEPGTVMVLGEEGALSPSHSPYDKRVAGVISGAGDFKPGIILDKQPALANRHPVALLGKVFCKVDAGHGAIEIGDLLTTSITPGHAMKADDPFKAFGAVIGKALRPLKEGQGLIPILIALQ